MNVSTILGRSGLYPHFFGYKAYPTPVTGPAIPMSLRNLLLYAAHLLTLLSVQSSATSQEPTFERQIRPILREYCFDCHGAMDKKEGGLDLRLVRFMKRGGDSGSAIDHEKPTSSLLIQRVVDGEMPPGESHLPPEKLDVLKRWVDLGTPTERPEPDQIGPGVPITIEDRDYWAFRPISRPLIPELADEAERIRTPIDALLKHAMPSGVSFSEDADRATLIRRAYFDLIGLPPSLDELERWSKSTNASWFEELIDRLLESPHYGERWSRHWLDVAGYADSEGQTAVDAVRPWAWKYRDYVIRSFNENKPFDRFIVEQLAGDELAGERLGDWTAEQIELLTATGFLTMAADGTGAGDNSPEARNKVIADTIKIVSSSLLGVSVGCAQCHDHRYDPISQLDYYAMRAVFEPAFDWQQWRTPDARRVSLHTIANREQAAAIEQEAQKVADERTAKQKVFMAEALEKEMLKYEEPLKTELRTAYETPEKERSEVHVSLLKKYPSVNITPGVLYQYLPKAAEELKAIDKQIAETRARKPAEEFIRAMTEVPDRVPDTLLFHRGDHQQPKQKVLPADLTIAADEGALPLLPERAPNLKTSGRRSAYARWLTGGKHPLVARVLVNRIWLHHFGQAIVPTPSEFGKLGIAPSHPQLLDWLADEFMQSGWDMKQLHRTIMRSTAWRQSSVREVAKSVLDGENKFHWRKSIQRLDAEVIRDRMLIASGTLEPSLFGPPIAIKADETGQIIVDGQQKRRSLYLQVRRSQPVAMLQSFDAPVMDVNCEMRPVSTVATQSLILMNGEFAWQQADLLAGRVVREAVPLTSEQLADQPEMPVPIQPEWRYGYGEFDEAAQRVSGFTDLPHWSGTEWQGGEKRPDPNLGWVIANPNGGHTGARFASVRRWTSTSDSRIRVDGVFQHGSAHGDGVRGRIVSDRRGPLGQWQVHNSLSATRVDEFAVEAGESIDFVTDCITNENSDSFTWATKIAVLERDGMDGERIRDSVAEFHGPVAAETYNSLPSQLHYAWRLAYCRSPTVAEFKLSMVHAVEQLRSIQKDRRGVAKGSSVAKQVLVNYCHALLNSSEFVYVD